MNEYQSRLFDIAVRSVAKLMDGVVLYSKHPVP